MSVCAKGSYLFEQHFKAVRRSVLAISPCRSDSLAFRRIFSRLGMKAKPFLELAAQRNESPYFSLADDSQKQMVDVCQPKLCV